MVSEASTKLFQRALSLIKVERPFDALPLLSQLIEAEPEWAEVYVQRARIRKRVGDKERAIADYAKAIKLEPKAETYLARALVWLELNQIKGAIADSRQVIALKPQLAGGHRVLGKALGLLGDGKGAIAAYKQAARCYLDDKDKDNAQKCIDAIEPLKALPEYSLRERYANELPSGAKNTPTAQKDDIPATPEAFLQRLEVMYEAGEYAKTLTELNWFLQIYPQDAKAIALRGVVHARMGNRGEAVGDLAMAAQLLPDGAPEVDEIRFRRGQMRRALSDCDGAIEEFSALIESAGAAQKPLAKYFSQRGDCYRLLENAEQAFKDYSNAVALDSENAALYELRADVQRSMGASEGAITDYQKAATLWLNQGNWQKHQQIVDAVRQVRRQTTTKGEGTRSGSTVQIKSYFRQLPVIEVLFDGIAKFDVVIDRNAPNSIITQRMANQLKLNSVSYQYVYLADGTPMELSIAKLRSVVVGETVVTDVYVAIAPDNATVVLGKDCFSAYSVRISGNEITFSRK